ncbi:hypothetical protein ES705_41383 [subsurface metagenome]
MAISGSAPGAEGSACIMGNPLHILQKKRAYVIISSIPFWKTVMAISGSVQRVERAGIMAKPLHILLKKRV